MINAFAKIWRELLESTVQDACDKLVMGATTGGLVA
jgi:hypothetical protein